MADLIYDASALGQLALKTGLVTEAQLEECWQEIGARSGDAEPLLRALERRGYLTAWQSKKLLKGDTFGYFYGGFRVLYKIASGSFGRVFRAEEPQSGRVVAIKVLRNRWSEDQAQIELFEREGKVGMSLRHPNIVEIIQVNRDPLSGSYYIVMEFVEGGNLRQILALRKKFEPIEAVRIIEDAASGLSHAYSRGVTHRDVKLTNILISSSGVAKLVDFGLAKVYSAIGGGAAEGDKGARTVDYAGLEKATGVKPGDVRSDIYFLGCVLYELLAGRSPLEMMRDKHARMQRQRFDNVPPMRPDEVTGPPSLFRLVETMMTMIPAQRYQTPAQLLDAVRAVRRDLEGGAGAGADRPAGTRSVFVVEGEERLQNAIRDKLKELGYRVFLSSDPQRALDRFRQQPFDALVLDAGTTEEEGPLLFERILTEAERLGLACAGILVLNEDQAAVTEKIKQRPTTAVLVRPGVTLKSLHRKLQELVPTTPP
jgi:CheY-like chemotaxis protein